MKFMEKKKLYIVPEIQTLQIESACILAGSDDGPGERYDQIEVDNEYCTDPD